MMKGANKRGFASDNNAGVHPDILEAMSAINEGHVLAYGEDAYTQLVTDRLKGIFGGEAEVFLVFIGTAANVLGLSAAGTTLALLMILGLAAFWLGRAIGQSTKLPHDLERENARPDFVLSDRAVAIWALACLVTIVPAGIAGLQLLVK